MFKQTLSTLSLTVPTSFPQEAERLAGRVRNWGIVATAIVMVIGSASAFRGLQSLADLAVDLVWVIFLFVGLKWAMGTGERWALLTILLSQGIWGALALSFQRSPPEAIPFFLGMTTIMLFLPRRLGLLLVGIVAAAGVLTVSGSPMLRWNPHPYHDHLPSEVQVLFFIVPASAAILFGSLVRHSLLSSFVVEDLAAELAQTNRELSAALEHAQELAASRERTRLARELHDSIGHYLTIGEVQLERSRYELVSKGERVSSSLGLAREAVRNGLRELRACVSVLREQHSERLSSAIKELIESFPGHSAELHVAGDERRLPTPIEFTLYRTAQEALTNVARHARAQHVMVTLQYLAAKAIIRVEDDGDGCAPVRFGNGLQGLKERADALNGDFSVAPVDTGGWRLECSLPVSPLESRGPCPQ